MIRILFLLHISGKEDIRLDVSFYICKIRIIFTTNINFNKYLLHFLYPYCVGNPMLITFNILFQYTKISFCRFFASFCTFKEGIGNYLYTIKSRILF